MAPPYPHLEHAPIAEAIIDLRVDAPDLNLEGLAGVYEVVKDDFPAKQDRFELLLGVDATAQVSHNDRKQVGWVAYSADRSRAVQGQLGGFSYSRLPKYKDWADLRDGAKHGWEQYCAVVKPRAITRVSVRFINRIELPRSLKDFEDYFQTFPKIGSSIPQQLSSVFARLVIPFDAATASVTQTFDGSNVTDAVVPVVLDIDVSLIAEFDPYSDEAWGELDKLRRIKNDVFFGSITEKLKGMYL